MQMEAFPIRARAHYTEWKGTGNLETEILGSLESRKCMLRHLWARVGQQRLVVYHQSYWLIWDPNVKHFWGENA